MVAKSILGALKPSAVNTIMLKKQYFRWTDSSGDTHDDCPNLLKLFFLEVNPSTKISLQHHKYIISSASLGGYGNNVNNMLNGVEHAYDTIISNKGTHDDYAMHIFKSLMLTKNSIFRDYIQDFKNRWEDDLSPILAFNHVGKFSFSFGD